MQFIGRKKELQQLSLLITKRSASLVVIRGRRHIGKSRLVQEFGKNNNLKTFVFSGLYPTENTTIETQLHEFVEQLGTVVDQPAFKDSSWNDAFSRLAQYSATGPVLILLNEISWMGSLDPDFLGKLKNAWDLKFSKNSNLILVLCGSVSVWIETNILNSTGFVVRISLRMTLEELPLADCNKFWPESGAQISAYEKYKILSVTGGVPRYLEEIQPQLSAEENIKNICFSRAGFLFNEFEHIFSDVFSNRSEIYKRIVQCIADCSAKREDVLRQLEVEKGGVVSEYLDDLVESGFVSRDYTWHLKTGERSKLSKYRISDNYLRFYLKYVLPNKDKIERDHYINQSLSSLPAWSTIMGLQFENLVLNNRHRVQEILGIKPEDIVCDNPFFQNKTAVSAGCQVDYLIQTRFNNLYVCEIKFSKNPVGSEVISEMQDKIASMATPRGFSIRPVLINVNGVSVDVDEGAYFSAVIDFSAFLMD